MSSKPNITSESAPSVPAEGIVSEEVENLGRAPTHNKQNAVDGADRQEMIATAAYYRAERRGFISSDEIQDWLEAEVEIDGLI